METGGLFGKLLGIVGGVSLLGFYIMGEKEGMTEEEAMDMAAEARSNLFKIQGDCAFTQKNYPLAMKYYCFGIKHKNDNWALIIDRAISELRMNWNDLAIQDFFIIVKDIKLNIVSFINAIDAGTMQEERSELLKLLKHPHFYIGRSFYSLGRLFQSASPSHNVLNLLSNQCNYECSKTTPFLLPPVPVHLYISPSTSQEEDSFLQSLPIFTLPSRDALQLSRCSFCLKSTTPTPNDLGTSNSDNSISKPVVRKRITCTVCDQERYCSHNCHMEAWIRYHNVLCSLSKWGTTASGCIEEKPGTDDALTPVPPTNQQALKQATQYSQSSTEGHLMMMVIRIFAELSQGGSTMQQELLQIIEDLEEGAKDEEGEQEKLEKEWGMIMSIFYDETLAKRFEADQIKERFTVEVYKQWLRKLRKSAVDVSGAGWAVYAAKGSGVRDLLQKPEEQQQEEAKNSSESL
eukprot:TRINITY_DN14767_c0_g1_i1.p1 TRINITY_DN14767_c0_g1~~TRINITY_DN14767_c0_g1_i1.p1  ORF type:complete len:461 (+),score=106.76 TRINITY_DN14767_c0_g1_i1:70-1452(+)